MTLSLRWPWPWWTYEYHNFIITKEFGVLQSENLILLIWPWPNDLDTQTWPRYGQDVLPYKILSFYSKLIAQTDRHTHTDGQTGRQTDRQTDRQTHTHISLSPQMVHLMVSTSSGQVATNMYVIVSRSWGRKCNHVAILICYWYPLDNWRLSTRIILD